MSRVRMAAILRQKEEAAAEAESKLKAEAAAKAEAEAGAKAAEAVKKTTTRRTKVRKMTAEDAE